MDDIQELNLEEIDCISGGKSALDIFGWLDLAWDFLSGVAAGYKRELQ